MNEQEISKAVEAVLGQLQKVVPPQENTHICKCKNHKMTLSLAKALIQRIEEKAASMGVAIVAAVSDASGRPVAVHCMDDAYIASFDVALNKTFTSASLKMSTAKLSTLCQPGQSLYGIQYTNGGKIVIFGGGEPLEAEDKIIGALGVSGGTAEQDTALAAYGKEVFKEVAACL